MKQELPISVLLLAAGGWFWFSNISPTHTAILKPTTNRPVAVATGPSESAQAVIRHDSPVSIGIESSHFSSENGVRILRQAADQLRVAAPFQTEINTSLRWANESYEFSGKYFQTGQGGLKNRLELALLPIEKGSMQLTHVYDGRFAYTQLRQNDQQKLHFLDLNQIQKTRSETGLSAAGHPMSWISHGGLGTSLENLATAFQWRQNSDSSESGNSELRLLGTWKPDRLAALLSASMTADQFKPEIQWDQLPAQIPHAVEITLKANRFSSLFPTQIAFYRFRNSQNGLMKSPLATFQYSDPVNLTIDENQMLNLETEGAEATDVTEDFVNQITQFKYLQQARQESETMRR